MQKHGRAGVNSQDSKVSAKQQLCSVRRPGQLPLCSVVGEWWYASYACHPPTTEPGWQPVTGNPATEDLRSAGAACPGTKLLARLLSHNHCTSARLPCIVVISGAHSPVMFARTPFTPVHPDPVHAGWDIVSSAQLQQLSASAALKIIPIACNAATHVCSSAGAAAAVAAMPCTALSRVCLTAELPQRTHADWHAVAAHCCAYVFAAAAAAAAACFVAARTSTTHPGSWACLCCSLFVTPLLLRACFLAFSLAGLPQRTHADGHAIAAQRAPGALLAATRRVCARRAHARDCGSTGEAGARQLTVSGMASWVCRSSSRKVDVLCCLLCICAQEKRRRSRRSAARSEWHGVCMVSLHTC